MLAKIKCVADAPGFSKGSSYEVLGYCETSCVVANNDGKVVSLAYAKINNPDLWDRSDSKSKKD